MEYTVFPVTSPFICGICRVIKPKALLLTFANVAKSKTGPPTMYFVIMSYAAVFFSLLLTCINEAGRCWDSVILLSESLNFLCPVWYFPILQMNWREM